MPNYFSTGGHAMKTECPHCGAFGEHKQVKTDPKHYRYNDDAEALFRAKCGKDISYRSRTRECRVCHGWFDTAEVSESFLHKLIESMLRDQARQVELEKKLRESACQLAQLVEKQNDVASRVMNTMAELRDPALSRRNLTLVPTVGAMDEATIQ